jgi:hypothetical protein
VTRTVCVGCNKPLIESVEGFPWHPGCIPQFTEIPGTKMTPFDMELREDLIAIIRWASNHAARSKQVALGCSEVGHDCDLRLAYKMAGAPVTGFGNDPWPAVVGTSIHSWMEQAIADYQAVHGISEWITEMEVLPSPLVKGHTDLYRKGLVLDWKFPSPDNLKKMRDDGVPWQYQVQVHLYGLGHVNAGRPVDRVGIVALGRQGWLKDMFIWTTEFDAGIAQAALERIYRIGGQLIDLDIENHPEAYATIPRTPSRLCGWCPWFRRDVTEVSGRGCPGYTAS